MTRIVSVVFAFALFAIGGAADAAADEWPSRPVRIVSPFAPGGTADILARLLADHLSNKFKQQFVVESRPGASGAIGLQSVVNAAPDGYTFVLGTVSILTLLPIINPKIGYDATRDLTNIAYVAGAPAVLSVNPAGGIKTLRDFVARARATERPFTFSSTGIGSDGHLLGEAFGSIAKVKVEHVPYKGAQQALTDLVGGHITFGMLTLPSTAGFLRGGTLSGLAVTSPERMRSYADIPTFKELGFTEMVSTTWFSFSGPAKLPKEIAEKLNREIVAATSTPAMQEKLQNDGLLTDPMSVEKFGMFVEQEGVRWKPIIESAGLVRK